MSDEQKCPGCGGFRIQSSTLPQFDCGTQIGDALRRDTETFYQSDTCKLRQSHQIVAECLQAVEDFGTHWPGCKLRIYDGSTEAGQCTCGLNQKLSAIQSRAKEICK